MAADPRPVLPVSVIIPVFNRRDEVTAAVASVQAQAGARVHATIVVDDASTDGSAQVAAGLGCELLRLTENGGSATARNAGLERVTTPWVCFLDSDDVWHPDLLRTLWAHAPDHVLVSGGGLLATGAGVITVLGPTSAAGQALTSPADLLDPANPVVTSATMVRTDAVWAVGGFDEGLRYSEDLDLWLRVLEHGTGWCDATPLITYHRAAGSKSQQAHGRVEEARARIVRRYEDRPWWSEVLMERYLGGMYWEGARSAARSGQWTAAARQLARLLRSPSRPRGVLACVARNRRLRQRAGEL